MNRRATFIDQAVTYGALGATLPDDFLRYPPTGFRSAEDSVRIGSGTERFARAAFELLHWQVQLNAGIDIDDQAEGTGEQYHGLTSEAARPSGSGASDSPVVVPPDPSADADATAAAAATADAAQPPAAPSVRPSGTVSPLSVVWSSTTAIATGPLSIRSNALRNAATRNARVRRAVADLSVTTPQEPAAVATPQEPAAVATPQEPAAVDTSLASSVEAKDPATVQEVHIGRAATLVFRSGLLAKSVPVRVVYVVREESRVGFAYGTTEPGPESGEEAFFVELRDDDSVWFTIRSVLHTRNVVGVDAWLTRHARRRLTQRELRSLHPAFV